MAGKPTYEELEQKVRALEEEDQIRVSDINIEWNTKAGTCTFEHLPVAMMWIDTTLAGLMSGVQAMVGTERFGLALQSEGRRSVEADWQVISQFSDFLDGFTAIANIAAVAGWGEWRLISIDKQNKECRFQVRDSWEGRYQKSLGVYWGSGMLAGKLAGYSSKLFKTNCWASQTRSIAKGDEFDEFVVKLSNRSIEKEIENLMATDRATRADMAVALEKLQKEVSVREKTEEALRESEERYRRLVHNAVVGVYQVSKEGKFSMVNQRMADMFGYNSPESFLLEVDNIIDLYAHPEERKTILEEIDEKGFVKEREVRFRKKDGGIFWTKINTTVYRGKEDIVYEGLMEDITAHKLAKEEKQKLEAQLQQAYKMEAIGTLAGGIAHDFNNILTPIIVQSELALMDIDEESPIRFNLQEVMKAGLRAKDLVKQILTFSRQSEQQPIPLRITTIIKEAIKLLRASLPATIEIQLSLQKEEDMVIADPTQIHQVLMNLCTNAAHAMRDKGGILNVNLNTVELDLENTSRYPDLKPGFYMKLAVSDTGHGIAPEVLDRIFDPFFTTKDRSEGTGMGLAVVHGIIKSYGGDIAIESELGMGTTFNVFIPGVKTVVTDEQQIVEEVPNGNERVMVIDDEPIMADTLCDMLDHLGYQSTKSTNSVEALELFKAGPDRYDLVITDQTMPNITGMELAQKLMEIRSDIPIILCTGFSEKVNEDSSTAMGISAFVLKPIVMSDIAHIIRKVLDAK